MGNQRHTKMMKAFVLLTLVACANAGAITSWTSGLRKGTSLATGAPKALAGDIEFKFTPATAVTTNTGGGVTGTVKITASAAIWTNTGTTSCTCDSTGGAQTCTAAVTAASSANTILTVTMADSKTLAGGALATITCSNNLANLGAAGDITFDIETSTDTTPLTGQTGYTINNGKATWTSAVP